MSNDKKYHADGTICMHFGDGGNKRVTFIPDRYVEQGGCQFVVFVPQADECQSAPKTTPALVVKAKDVPLLSYPYFKGKEALLLQAAVSRQGDGRCVSVRQWEPISERNRHSGCSG